MSFKQAREKRIEENWETLMGKKVENPREQDPKNQPRATANDPGDLGDHDNPLSPEARKTCKALGLDWRKLDLAKILAVFRALAELFNTPQVMETAVGEGGDSEKSRECCDRLKQCCDDACKCCEEAQAAAKG